MDDPIFVYLSNRSNVTKKKRYQFYAKVPKRVDNGKLCSTSMVMESMKRESCHVTEG